MTPREQAASTTGIASALHPLFDEITGLQGAECDHTRGHRQSQDEYDDAHRDASVWIVLRAPDFNDTSREDEGDGKRQGCSRRGEIVEHRQDSSASEADCVLLGTA
ncbi:hypothetical protein MKK75_09045 [Methylobacterium sp. J-030]|uniref:hypothetical protein n=1 Tax=Methylobacterium sp. J-030 TaxID=2836627 RepID=UPI001FBB6C12|nr:hypothetical protein [Methylobacterium sp. J-030]MCJ2068946.1 hypothetical protein [Methylobacterium sp. J-030]